MNLFMHYLPVLAGNYRYKRQITCAKRSTIKLSCMKHLSAILTTLTLSIAGFSQNAQPTATIEFISPELSKIISKDAKVEVIADGFQFTEGPLWFEKQQMLLLSDVPGNTIYKWTEAKGKEVYVRPGGYTDTAKRGGFMGPNGLILSADGKSVVCQHGDRRVAMMDAPLDAPQSEFVTVAGQYNGKRLNSPNDLFLAKTGDLYSTDPAYGFERGPRDPKPAMRRVRCGPSVRRRSWQNSGLVNRGGP
jgi:gluconolactonase